MWEMRKARPLGSLSVRKLLTLVATLLVTTFAYILVSAPSAFAAEATWNGDALVYEGNQYVGPTQAGSDNLFNLPEESRYYVFIEPAIPEDPDRQRKAFVIYFAPGSDPGTTTTAQYITYDYLPPDNYTNPTNPVAITVTPQADSPEASSCDGTFTFGLGWILCPVTNVLASGMDWVFSILSGFLEVRPVQSEEENSLKRAWEYMRSFANIAFVIGFLIIIYSQLTNIGVSNYGIKRLLPRLIVAAILVNISYYICAIAIDLANIIGYSLQDIFIAIRNGLVGTEGNSWDLISWQGVTEFILSGGAIVGGGVAAYLAGATAVQGAIGGAIFLLIPALVSGLLAVIVAVAILAARQAIITVLVVIAPLAFVAYLLPNTEKWFEKWRDLFMTMLIMFPAFSLVFGGSQLAGAVIIQNADSITTILLGLVVQIAPLFVLPLLMKLSGSLLGRIAGMVNDPRKGLVDRTKAWSQERLGEHNAEQAKRNREMAANGTLKRRNVFRRTALARDDLKRNRERIKAANETSASALFNDTESGHKLHTYEHEANQLKEQVESNANIRLQQEINSRGSKLHLDNVRLEASKISLERENEKTSSDIKEYKTGLNVSTGELAQLTSQMKEDTIFNAAEVQRGQSAANMQQKNISQAFTETSLASDALIKIAKGVDPAGANRARANAAVNLGKINSEARDNIIKLFEETAIQSGSNLKKYTENIASMAIEPGGMERAQAEGYDTEAVQAAFEQQAREGNMVIFQNARGSREIDQTMLSQVISRNIGTFKQKGGFHLQANPNLAIRENESPDSWRIRMNIEALSSLADTPPEGIQDLKAGWFNDIHDNVLSQRNIAHMFQNTTPDQSRELQGYIQAVYDNFYLAKANPDVMSKLDTRKTKLGDMYETLTRTGYEPSPYARDINERQNDGDENPPNIVPPAGPGQTPPTGPSDQGER